MPKRGVNIYKRKDGRWEGRIKKDNIDNTTRKYIYVYGKTYTEVRNKMNQIKNIPKPIKREEHTLEEIISIWLKEYQISWKQSTYAVYCQIANKYIIPLLGDIEINCINEQIIEKFLSEIERDKNGNMLSSRYLRNICAVILRVMSYAKRKYHYEIEIPENLVIPTRQRQIFLPREKDMEVLEKYLLGNAENDTCLGILIALYTGLRIGEVCALTWGDINLNEEIVYVSKNLQRVKVNDVQTNSTQILIQTPKTTTSLRIIPIPPVLLPYLKKSKKDDARYIIEGKKTPWTEPRTLQYRFAQILKKCHIEHFNFHMLRHVFATRCIEKGFDAKSLSEILGHSSIQVTLNLYVHSNMQHKKKLMEKFDVCLYQNYSSAVS